MCDFGLTAVAVTTAAAAASAAAMAKQANDQATTDNAYRALAIGNTDKARELEKRDAHDAYKQSADEAHYEAHDAALASAKAKSTARVEAGEAGVSGNSVNDLMLDFVASEKRYLNAIDKKIDFQKDEQARQTDRADQNYRTRILRIGPTSQKRSVFGSAITGGLKGAASSGSSYLSGM